jgi:hypothetical protein
MSAEKVIQGADLPFEWADGYSRHEKFARFPLEVGGELPGAHLMVVGFPDATDLKFRLSLCFNAALSRLDFTDEYHPNSLRVDGDGVPPSVNGPHYHSWSVNRRFSKSVTSAVELKNAVRFESPARTFDAVLRWYCEETRIVGLGTGHRIELPRRERLL